MNIWRGQFFSLAVVAAGCLLTGCNQSSPGPNAGGDVIKVGDYGSLTGSEATFGQSTHKGIQQAVDEINAAGGVLGKKIELHTEDDQSQAGQAATVVRKLISSDGVVAMLGEVASSRSLEAAPICQQSGIPMVPRPPPIPRSPRWAITFFASALLIPSKARSWPTSPPRPSRPIPPPSLPM